MPSRALARDGFRCLVTDLFNTESLERNPELTHEWRDLGTLSPTVEARLLRLNESTMQNIDPVWSSGIIAVENKARTFTCLESSLASVTALLRRIAEANKANTIVVFFSDKYLLADLLPPCVIPSQFVASPGRNAYTHRL